MEFEREPDGRALSSVTVFLTGAECPFTCVFCDLWRHTLAGPTPIGALPAQLGRALGGLPADRLTGRLKLYNASNFFDPRAVPPEDLPRLADLTRPFERVVVECHARLVGDACVSFAERLDGRLEVALGLEVADDTVLARLGKDMSLAAFDAATDRLNANAIPWRAFVLVGPPFVPAEARAEQEARALLYAFARGAERAALIPTRGGNGAMESLAGSGHFAPPSLRDLEAALDRAVTDWPGRVAADLWDLEAFGGCAKCLLARRARLTRINHSGRAEPPTGCDACTS